MRCRIHSLLCEAQNDRSKTGSALVIALFTLMTVAALGVVFLQTTTSTTNRQVAEVDNLSAFYLAEAGLAESFQALRMGRSGQVGSEEAPAKFGTGLLWVDAVETPDGQVRLTCTAMAGRGRASLALVVEPIETPLGFFSDEELLIKDVLLVDGFNSEEATYEQEVLLISDADPFLEGDSPGGTTSISVPDPYFTTTQVDGDANVLLDLGEGLWGAGNYGDKLLASQSDPVVVAPPVEVHTSSGGLISSNETVRFGTSGKTVDIYGDVVPGPNGIAESRPGVTIYGDSDARPAKIGLEPVRVPNVTLQPSVVHDGLLPMVVAPGTSGHSSITVAPGAEIVLRGPATIVIGILRLEPGASMTLDTRDGDVALYVTGGMDLQAGSLVETTSDYPDQLSIQVSAIARGIGGAPVNLEATSQFHGTIYSPETDVHIGSNFEVYGGIVAKRLEIGAGARLHFDTARYESSPIPRIVSWRIAEIPATVRRQRTDPFKALGLRSEWLVPMSQAHDLTSVELTIAYLDHGGAEHNFDGTEDQFDWSGVSEILELHRDAKRPQEAPAVAHADSTGGIPSDSKAEIDPKDPKVPEDPEDLPEEVPKEPTAVPTGVRQEIFDSVMALNGSNTEALAVINKRVPLSAEEWDLICNREPAISPMTIAMIKFAEEFAASHGGKGGK